MEGFDKVEEVRVWDGGLPQEPNQLANLIQFFVKEYPKFQNFSDCIEIMTKSNHLSDIGKPRIKNCVIHILRSISLNEDFDVVFSTESDFTTKDISDKLFASFWKACRESSASLFVAPIKFVGLTALSLDIKVKNLTLFVKAK